MKISIGYSDSQDRMWLRAGSEGSLWWITRRMCLRLIGRWAELLERTAPVNAEGKPDADAAAVERQRRARHEHQVALASPSQGPQADEDNAAAPPDPGTLVYSVELSANDSRLRLTLLSSGNRQAIAMPRADAHRMLAALVARCRHNGWVDTPLPAWFREDGDASSKHTVVS